MYSDLVAIAYQGTDARRTKYFSFILCMQCCYKGPAESSSRTMRCRVPRCSAKSRPPRTRGAVRRQRELLKLPGVPRLCLYTLHACICMDSCDTTACIMQVGSFVELQVTSDAGLDKRQQLAHLHKVVMAMQRLRVQLIAHCCSALAVLENTAKIIHSLEIREAQMP